MAFKKKFESEKPVIIIQNSDKDDKFPPGFCYRIEGIIYTVKEDVTQEKGSPMRKVILSDGATEIIPVESIIKDLKDHGCEILPLDKRFAKKEPEKKDG